MSERMTDDMWHGGQHGMTRAMLHAEGTRARASEDQKDAVIKALADVLEVVTANAEDRGLQWRVHMSPAQMDAVTAALRLAGRL